MSHCAVKSGKWGSVLYNELNPLVYDAFKGCMEGTIDTSNASRWVSREDFFKLKDTDGLVALVWSFGNNMVDYMFSTAIEPWKKALWYARVEGDCSLFKEMGIDTDGSSSDIRRHADEYSRLYISWYESAFGVPFKGGTSRHPFELESMYRLQCVERLGDLPSIGGSRLESVERLIEFTCGSYEDYVYRDGDVVYCDIPYQTPAARHTKALTGKGSTNGRRQGLSHCSSHPMPYRTASSTRSGRGAIEHPTANRPTLLRGRSVCTAPSHTRRSQSSQGFSEPAAESGLWV